MASLASVWSVMIKLSIILLSKGNSYIHDTGNYTATPGVTSRILSEDTAEITYIAKSLLLHYKKLGIVDVPDRFDGKRYVKKYSDLVSATDEDAWLHWVQFGRYEDRIYFEVPEAIPKSAYDSVRSSSSSRYIHIVYGVDDDNAASTMVSVASIIKFSTARNRLYFHFILVDLSWDSDFIKDIASSFGKSSKYEMKAWRTIPEIIRSTEKSPATFAVFYAGQLFPSLHRFIYLSSPMYAVKSMDDLWNVRLGNSVVAMMDECSNNFYKQAINKGTYNVHHSMFKQIFGIGVNRQSCYPDASVVVMNQLLFNELRILDRVTELIELQLNQNKFLFKLEMQSLMVMTNYDHYLPLHGRWNMKRRSMSGYNGPVQAINTGDDYEQQLQMKILKKLVEEKNVNCKEMAMGSTRSRDYVICALSFYAYRVSTPSVKKLFKPADSSKSVIKKVKQVVTAPIASSAAGPSVASASATTDQVMPCTT